MRAVAQDPQAYAVLRLAETRRAAQELTAVPDDATGSAFDLPPKKNARALGILDGLTRTYARDRAWRTALLGHLVHAPAGPLTSSWIQMLKGTSQDQLTDRLGAQGVDMALAWADTRHLEESTKQRLHADVQTSEIYAFMEIKP